MVQVPVGVAKAPRHGPDRCVSRGSRYDRREGLDQPVGDQPVQGAGPLHRLVPHRVQHRLRAPARPPRAARRGACRAPAGPCPRTSGRAAAAPSCAGLPGQPPGALGRRSGSVRSPRSSPCTPARRAPWRRPPSARPSRSSSGSRARASLRSAAVVAFGGYWTPVDGPREDAPHVGVEHGVPLAVREGGHRGGRVLADPGQREQLRVLASVRRRRAAPLSPARRRAAAARGAGSRAGPRRGRPRRRASAARSAGRGQRASHCSYTGRTRLTGVCWSMNSLTITPQAPASGRRQGRSRACSSNQSMRGACRAAGLPGAGGVADDGAIGGVVAVGLRGRRGAVGRRGGRRSSSHGTPDPGMSGALDAAGRRGVVVRAGP